MTMIERAAQPILGRPGFSGFARARVRPFARLSHFTSADYFGAHHVNLNGHPLFPLVHKDKLVVLPVNRRTQKYFVGETKALMEEVRKTFEIEEKGILDKDKLPSEVSSDWSLNYYAGLGPYPDPCGFNDARHGYYFSRSMHFKHTNGDTLHYEFDSLGNLRVDLSYQLGSIKGLTVGRHLELRENEESERINFSFQGGAIELIGGPGLDPIDRMIFAAKYVRQFGPSNIVDTDKVYAHYRTEYANDPNWLVPLDPKTMKLPENRKSENVKLIELGVKNSSGDARISGSANHFGIHFNRRDYLLRGMGGVHPFRDFTPEFAQILGDGAEHLFIKP